MPTASQLCAFILKMCRVLCMKEQPMYSATFTLLWLSIETYPAFPPLHFCTAFSCLAFSGTPNFLRYLLWLRLYKWKSVEVDVFRRGLVLLVNISRGRVQFRATAFGVERLEISLFRTVLRYWQTIISLWHNRRIWQTDRQSCDSNTMRCIACSHMVKILNQVTLLQLLQSPEFGLSLQYFSAGLQID